MPDETIILVHGLWMTGYEMSLLKRRLRSRGYTVDQFRYRMVTRDLQHNSDRLRDFIARQRTAKVHLIGHSLGGVLALQTLRKYPELQVDRVVCLGSPLVDSEAGRRVVKFRSGRAILGKTLPQALFDFPLVEWTGAQEVGVIAGTRSFGLGRIVGGVPFPNDGMVAVAETLLPGITDHVKVCSGHAALVLDPQVAVQAAWFIRHGKFRRH